MKIKCSLKKKSHVGHKNLVANYYHIGKRIKIHTFFLKC